MRIFVGLSGGVDSAVTAALLLEEGHDVIGVFIKGWYPPGLPCSWAEDRRDAMRVAAHLGIGFVTLDASVEYKKSVIDYLLAEYRKGRTPNPDIMCNREVKFGAFHRFAKEKGADMIATGHYARVEGGMLLKGIDAAKDQSYFLWAVPRNVLRDVRFPLGQMRKERTRALAHTYRLPNAAKRDSQGICFLGAVSVDEFLRAEFGIAKGVAVDERGREIGTHEGVHLSTIGERVALEGAPQGPWYVVAKEITTNTLTVSKSRAMMAHPDAIRLTSVNILADTSGEVQAQTRYHGSLVRGTYDLTDCTFSPNEPLPELVAKGQSLVLYRDDTVLGGGIID